MLIACHPNSFGRFGVEGALQVLAETGIRWIELPVKTEGVPSIFGETPVLTDQSSPADARRVRQRLEQAGLAVCSANITSGNPLHQPALDATLKKLELIAELGIGLAVAGAGEVVASEQRPVLLRNLSQIGDRAAALGIVYCCETHPGLCVNADAMLETMQSLDHDHVRLNFDTGNILYYNAGADVAESLTRVVRWVRHVHLKDSNGSVGYWHFPALGEGGAVDFRRVREMLAAGGYDGPCSLELEGIRGEPPLTLDQHRQRLSDSMAHLQRCGYFE